MFIIVRKYVEGMKDSTQLLDLLAAVGTATGRQVLYPDVRSSHITITEYLFIILV